DAVAAMDSIDEDRSGPHDAPPIVPLRGAELHLDAGLSSFAWCGGQVVNRARVPDPHGIATEVQIRRRVDRELQIEAACGLLEYDARNNEGEVAGVCPGERHHRPAAARSLHPHAAPHRQLLEPAPTLVDENEPVLA